MKVVKWGCSQPIDLLSIRQVFNWAKNITSSIGISALGINDTPRISSNFWAVDQNSSAFLIVQRQVYFG